MTQSRLTVALVTWNSLANTRDLLDALERSSQVPHELIVIDNASTDGTREYLRERGGLTLVENAMNARCARATNQAIALSRTELFVYLCAAHATVRPGWDSALLDFMDGTRHVSLAGDVWNPYGFLLPSRHYRSGWTPRAHGRDHLLHVQGGAWIARRALFDEVGGFAEEEYPHAGMDVEFSYRLMSFGKSLGRCRAIESPPWPGPPRLRPDAFVYHPSSESLTAEIRQLEQGETAQP